MPASDYFDSDFSTPPFVPSTRRKPRIPFYGNMKDLLGGAEGMPAAMPEEDLGAGDYLGGGVPAAGFFQAPDQGTQTPLTSDNRTAAQPRRFPKMEALQAIGEEPTAEQFPPNKKMLLAALAMGALSAFGPGAVEAGVPYQTTSWMLQDPYRRALQAYGSKRKKAESEAEAERRQFELETGASREARESERFGMEKKETTEREARQAGTPVRSYSKKMPDGTHLIDVYLDAQGQEIEKDRGLKGAEPREDTTVNEWDVYLKAAGGDYNEALKKRNADLARLAGIRTGGVDERAINKAKLDAARRKDAALREAEDDFRDPRKRGFYKNTDVLNQRKQAAQNAYENELATMGADVIPFRYGTQPGQPTAKPAAPAAAAGGKVKQPGKSPQQKAETGWVKMQKPNGMVVEVHPDDVASALQRKYVRVQ